MSWLVSSLVSQRESIRQNRVVVHCILCSHLYIVIRSVSESGAASDGRARRSEQVIQQNKGDTDTSNKRSLGNERRVCILHTKTKIRGLSPRTNYTDRATAAC
jgi:hypothetical protein